MGVVKNCTRVEFGRMSKWITAPTAKARRNLSGTLSRPKRGNSYVQTDLLCIRPSITSSLSLQELRGWPKSKLSSEVASKTAELRGKKFSMWLCKHGLIRDNTESPNKINQKQLKGNKRSSNLILRPAFYPKSVARKPSRWHFGGHFLTQKKGWQAAIRIEFCIRPAFAKAGAVVKRFVCGLQAWCGQLAVVRFPLGASTVVDCENSLGRVYN